MRIKGIGEYRSEPGGGGCAAAQHGRPGMHGGGERLNNDGAESDDHENPSERRASGDNGTLTDPPEVLVDALRAFARGGYRAYPARVSAHDTREHRGVRADLLRCRGSQTQWNLCYLAPGCRGSRTVRSPKLPTYLAGVACQACSVRNLAPNPAPAHDVLEFRSHPGKVLRTSQNFAYLLLLSCAHRHPGCSRVHVQHPRSAV